MDCILFKGLTASKSDEIQKLLPMPETKFKGEEIYLIGNIGILVNGQADVLRFGESGISVTMRTLCSGDIFGAASVFGFWQKELSSIKAVTDCNIVYIPEEKFKKLLADYPDLHFNYTEYLTDRIRFLNRCIDTFSADTTERKIYEFFISHSDENGIVELDFGMTELAKRLKIGRSSLYRGIDSLIENGMFIRKGNRFTILKF